MVIGVISAVVIIETRTWSTGQRTDSAANGTSWMERHEERESTENAMNRTLQGTEAMDETAGSYSINNYWVFVSNFNHCLWRLLAASYNRKRRRCSFPSGFRYQRHRIGVKVKTASIVLLDTIGNAFLLWRRYSIGASARGRLKNSIKNQKTREVYLQQRRM